MQDRRYRDMGSSRTQVSPLAKTATWPRRERVRERESPRKTAWYACYTNPRAEKKVDGVLAQRGIPAFLPIVSMPRQWHDRRKIVSMPLFPSYVFAHFDAMNAGAVLRVPGVLNIVRFDGRLAPITNEEIENIARFVRAVSQSGYVPAPVEFQVGQRVRITSGPFEGVEGEVLEARGHRRVLVGLRALRLGFEVNVPVESLKAVGGVA
jgi:transcription antitermination factor NusG